MNPLSDEQVSELRHKIGALRTALDDFEKSLIEPDAPAVAEVELTPEVEEFLQSVVPADERERLAEVVPQLAEVGDEDGARPRKR